MPFYVLQYSLYFSTGSSVSNQRLYLQFILFSRFNDSLETRLVIEANIGSGGVTRGGMSFYDFASKNIRYTFGRVYLFVGDDYI
ncbi:hypothetical protein QQP08_007696 [Theobroma cacao]|nr:hypothetical protein QQP08_007696 [Theobroma cacao]